MQLRAFIFFLSRKTRKKTSVQWILHSNYSAMTKLLYSRLCVQRTKQNTKKKPPCNNNNNNNVIIRNKHIFIIVFCLMYSIVALTNTVWDKSVCVKASHKLAHNSVWLCLREKNFLPRAYSFPILHIKLHEHAYTVAVQFMSWRFR